jgi:hypothetical protein
MLLTKEVEVSWQNKNKKWYQDKGYIFTKLGDALIVKVEDLPKSSHVNIEILCDVCLNNKINTKISKPYYKYTGSKVKNNLDCCNKCKGTNIRNSILVDDNRFHYTYEQVYNDFLKENKLLQTLNYKKLQTCCHMFV